MKNVGRIAFITAIFILISGDLYAKKDEFKVSGRIVNSDGDKIGGADVILLDENGKEVDKTSTGKLLRGKGKFKIKDVVPGTYTLNVFKEDEGTSTVDFTVENDDVKLDITLGKAAGTEEDEADIQMEEPERLPEDEYVINELSFELKKMTAELNHLGSQVRDLRAKSEMWVNPLSIYSKEIIMENGSTVFGKVVYQDEEIIKVETLVGYLVIDRGQVVRIIENVIGQEEPEYIPEQIRETYSPPPMPKLAEPRYTSMVPTERLVDRDLSANIVLVGNITEMKDRSNNITFSGEVKNIGGRRADFSKINFVFRKNWSGETKTLTTFVRGTYHTFDSGITTDSSLLPGATGTFEMLVPATFGSFIGYSYTIDWEEYE